MDRKPMTPIASLESLKQAVPFLRMYRGKTFVIKLGGETIGTRGDIRSLLEQIDTLHACGVRTLVVHGGGTASTELASKLNVQTEMVDGRRVTSKEMLEVLSMSLNGKVQAEILSVAKEIGMLAVGLSGLDGELIIASRRAAGSVDYGEVGDIEAVKPELLTRLMDEGYVPVVSPLCLGPSGELLNVNADTVAAEVAASLSAEKLIFVGAMPGILRDLNEPSTLISHLTSTELQAMEDSGALKTGMLPKAKAILGALSHGVERVHLVGASVTDSLLVEIFTNEGCGTLVTR